MISEEAGFARTSSISERVVDPGATLRERGRHRLLAEPSRQFAARWASPCALSIRLSNFYRSTSGAATSGNCRHHERAVHR
jgi:hypothetical protein